MEKIITVGDKLIGYTLPPEFSQLNELIKMQTLGGKFLGYSLPSQFLKMNELVEIHNLSGKNLGYVLPPEITNISKIIQNFTEAFKHKDIASLTKSIEAIQSFVKQQELESGIDTQPIFDDFSQVSDELKEKKSLSFKQICKLILLVLPLLSLYPVIKEMYKDITDNPFAEICGVLSELEEEAVRFVEVNHHGGIPLYQYPTGKKSEHYLLEGEQICMVALPKGNAKRVRVIYQLENHTQISGYVDRNKIKRLYGK